RPDEFARPAGCVLFADCKSDAAEFTAPHAPTNHDPSTRALCPARSTSTASTVFPFGSVIRRRALALVHHVTFGRSIAWRMQQTSASLLAWTLQGNELQVLQSTHPPASPGRTSPSGSGDGC